MGSEWKIYIEVLVPILLVLTGSLIVLSEKSWVPKHDVDEPPLVPQRIPYIGHVVGLFRHGLKDFEFTRYIKCAAHQ